MNLTTLKKCWIFCFLCLFSMIYTTKAQDIHYSMFNRTPFNISPGLVGVFGGDVRLAGSYRSQWAGLVDYKTFTASFEHKLYLPKIKRGFFTGGLYVNYDDAGDLSLNQTQFGGALSYVFPLSKQADNRHFLSGGVAYGFTQRNFDASKLQVEAQYVGDVFDPSLSPQELNLPENVFFGSLGGGINYRFQNPNTREAKRFRLDIGGAVYHLARGENAFGQDGNRLDRRVSLYGINAFQIRETWDLGLLISKQFQGDYEELIFGVNGRKYFDAKKMAFLLGVSYRAADFDAIIPNINVDYQNFSFGLSYGINVSQVTLDNLDELELSFISTFGKKRVNPKPCIIF